MTAEKNAREEEQKFQNFIDEQYKKGDEVNAAIDNTM